MKLRRALEVPGVGTLRHYAADPRDARGRATLTIAGVSYLGTFIDYLPLYFGRFGSRPPGPGSPRSLCWTPLYGTMVDAKSRR